LKDAATHINNAAFFSVNHWPGHCCLEAEQRSRGER